jgi:CRP/FNR family transcriptional regulator
MEMLDAPASPTRLSTELFASAKPVRLAADEVLFHALDTSDGCYRIEEGLLKVTMASRPGTERILTFLGPGAIVGELSLIDGLPHLAAAVAVRDTTLSVISRSAFAVFAEKHPEVYKFVHAARQPAAQNRSGAGSFLPQSSRVALTLLELAEEFGQNAGSGRIVIRQKIGQRDLAARAGIARETVSRILNDWKRRKLISRVSGYYCLENRTQLQHEAEVTGE